jgi:hypothetical protein
MTIYQLLLEIFVRLCVWGIGAGAVCGAVYGTILVPIFGTIIGAISGCILGFVLGVINGAVLSNITAYHYYPLLNFKVYRRTTSVLSAVISGLGVAFLMWVAAFGGRGQSTEMQVVASLAICVVVPAFIAGLTAVIATRQVTGWYKMNADRVTPQPKPIDARE